MTSTSFMQLHPVVYKIFWKQTNTHTHIHTGSNNQTLLQYLDVLLAVDIHVDNGAKPDQTVSHFHILFPAGRNGSQMQLILSDKLIFTEKASPNHVPSITMFHCW